jgi:hypothetical protein
MKLDRADAELFHALYHPLLCFANRELGVVKGLETPADVKRASLADLSRIRDAMYDHPGVIGKFVHENPYGLPPEKLEIVSGLKDFVRGTFIVMRCVENGAVMLSPEEKPVRAYGVQALFSPFEEMLEPVLPAMVEAVLVPFCGGITYDGIVHRQNVVFGAGIRSSFEDGFRDAKSRFGIVTSLPFSAAGSQRSGADRLRAIMKSEHGRLVNVAEIHKLRLKDRALEVLYHQEMGRVYERAIGKRARQLGLSNAWFALLEGVTVAAAETKDDVERTVERIVPADKRDLVHIFRLKGS